VDKPRRRWTGLDGDRRTRAAARPAEVRSGIIARSNSANEATICTIVRPAELVAYLSRTGPWVLWLQESGITRHGIDVAMLGREMLAAAHGRIRKRRTETLDRDGRGLLGSITRIENIFGKREQYERNHCALRIVSAVASGAAFGIMPACLICLNAAAAAA
jgi:hypothetical protein